MSGELNELLLHKPFVGGFTPTAADAKKFAELFADKALADWVVRLSRFSAVERAAFPAAPAAAAPAAAKKDDDDIDLFGDDDDGAPKPAPKKKEAAKVKATKSLVILDVKPWDDETNLDEMERLIREIKIDGLTWGNCKKVPVVSKIYKLQFNVVIEDDKVASTEDFEDPIKALEDYVQSVDIASWNKL